MRREIIHVLDDLIGKGDPRSGVRKRAAIAIGMTESELSKHMNAKKPETFFHIEEIGSLRGFVAREYAIPPPGWPLVTFKAWDEFREMAARSAPTRPKN